MRRFEFCPRCATPLETRRLEEDRERLVCRGEGCGFVFYDNPLPVVAALCEHEGEILLARNKGWPEGWFGLVTGFLERGEGPEEGVLRELREELGLEGEIVRLIGVYPFPELNQLIIAYHVRARGQICLGAELEGYKRVSPERLRPWPMGTGHAVRDWLEGRKSPGP